MDQLQNALQKEDFDKFLHIFSEIRLETLINDKLPEKTISKLDSKKQYDTLYEFLLRIAKYSLSVLDYELKEGIKILISNKFEGQALELFKICAQNSKPIDEYVLKSVINSCFRNKTYYDKCFELVVLIQSKPNNLSHSFWQEVIESFIKANEIKYANQLILVYPIKYSYSEGMWRNFIKSQMKSESLKEGFGLLVEKFERRTIHDEFKSFETIFNIFIEEVTNSYANLDQVLIEKIFETVLRLKIIIKEQVLENFLLKVIRSNLQNFVRVRSYLIKADCMLTVKVLEKIINEYGKTSENFAIFNIIKLCKTKKLQVPLHMLNIEAKVMKSLVQFMFENTISSFDESFCDSLSVDNKSYLLKNFSVASSRQNSQADMGFADAEKIEKDEFDKSEIVDSQSINSKSYVKCEEIEVKTGEEVVTNK